MSRRNRGKNRCPQCFMRMDLCYCAEIRSSACSTRLVLVMNSNEQYKPSSTARLLKSVLPQTELYVAGAREGYPDLDFLLAPEANAHILFPSDDAPVLDQSYLSRLSGPLTLVVPDGTWQQAKRLASHRALALRHLPRVKLAGSQSSRYQLRKSHSEYGLCTLEAVAYALAELEGEEVRDLLLKNLDVLIERVLWSRRTGALFTGGSVPG